MSTAKGISAGCGAPVVSVNVLDAYALGLEYFDGAVVPVLDARKKRFYSTVFVSGKQEDDYLDISAEGLFDRVEKFNNVLFIGSGCRKIMPHDKEKKYKYHLYDSSLAVKIAESGSVIFKKRGSDADDQGPFYIRKSDAEILKND